MWRRSRDEKLRIWHWNTLVSESKNKYRTNWLKQFSLWTSLKVNTETWPALCTSKCSTTNWRLSLVCQERFRSLRPPPPPRDWLTTLSLFFPLGYLVSKRLFSCEACRVQTSENTNSSQSLSLVSFRFSCLVSWFLPTCETEISGTALSHFLPCWKWCSTPINEANLEICPETTGLCQIWKSSKMK